MKKSVLTFVAAAAMVVAGSAQAVELSGNVAITNDYVWRGISQTTENPAIQGGFDLAAEGFYAGVWGSNANWAPGMQSEFDLYLGYGGDITDDLSFDIGVIRYMYPDTTFDVDFTEIYGSVSFMGATLGVALDNDNDATYINLGYDLSLPNDFGVGFHYGDYSFDAGGDYNDYSITLSKSAGGFDFSLGWVDTDISGVAEAESRVVFAVAKSL